MEPHPTRFPKTQRLRAMLGVRSAAPIMIAMLAGSVSVMEKMEPMIADQINISSALSVAGTTGNKEPLNDYVG